MCYVNDQIRCGKYLKSNVFHIDETNIYFGMTYIVTLAKYRLRTINIRGAGTSAKCTILLVVAMDSKKLPLFIIFKERQGRRVICKFAGDNFP